MMNMTVRFNHTRTANRSKSILWDDKNTYKFHMSDDMNMSFKTTKDGKFTKIMAKFRDYFNYAMFETHSP